MEVVMLTLNTDLNKNLYILARRGKQCENAMDERYGSLI